MRTVESLQRLRVDGNIMLNLILRR